MKKIFISMPLEGYDIIERHNTAFQVRKAVRDTVTRLTKAQVSVVEILHILTVTNTIVPSVKIGRGCAAVAQSDMVIFLPGWEEDSRCFAEWCVAGALGKIIWYYDEFDKGKYNAQIRHEFKNQGKWRN